MTVTDVAFERTKYSASAFTGGESMVTLNKGRSPFPVYSFPFAGLDPSTGDPIGYVGGKPSKSYADILYQAADTANLVYHGSGRPTFTGSFNHIFSYKNISLLFSVSYRLGYYFKRNTINYTDLFDRGKPNADFAKRWQKPGDELITTIPSMIYPDESYGMRDMMYDNSTPNIRKGDHVRFEYVRLDYTITSGKVKIPVNNIQLYAMVRNIGIIWRANKEKLDPDYVNGQLFPAQKSFVIGLNIGF
jgi:hypothetical protein